MKSLSQIIQETVAQPKGGDEKRFKAQHTIDAKLHPTHDAKSMIASIVKKKRLADREDDKDAYDQAYDKEDDEDIYDPIVGEETILEAGMTDSQMKKREEIVKSMKDKTSDFKDRYGDKWKEVMYATATKQAMQESVELGESVIDDLKKIVSTKSASSVKFEDGQKLKVDMTTAGAMVKVHDALNDANKKKFADSINKNENMFMKMVDFAFSKVK